MNKAIKNKVDESRASKLSISALFLSVTFLPFLLSGCATLSKDECMLGNWQAIGYSDGAAGYDIERLDSHSKACAKVGASPDYQAWEQGRQQGLQQYCTEINAYEIGKQGWRLRDVCPAEINFTLQRINTYGLEYYDLSQQIEADREQMQALKREYEQLSDGDNLDFATEEEARAYLLLLPERLRRSEQRIENRSRALERLRQQHGY